MFLDYCSENAILYKVDTIKYADIAHFLTTDSDVDVDMMMV